MDLKEKVSLYGFVKEQVPYDIDIIAEINRLRKEKNAIILAHYYQESEIQDIADYVGDSLGLSRAAANTDADIILFAGVHFMAETAKILNPHKKVLIPDLNAGCSLSESCPPDLFREFIKQYPNHVVITYINSSAEVKAMSDVIVTSSNSVVITDSFPKDQPIIFAPDKNLGRYVQMKTGRDNIIIWEGACMVHEIFNVNKIEDLLEEYPGAELIAHPECEVDVLQKANFVGSTSQLLRYVQESDTDVLIVATEPGILHQMQKVAPYKTLIPAPSSHICACNNCPHMKLNTLEKIYLALKYEEPEIFIPEEIRVKALKAINKMLELSDKLKIK